MRKVLLAGGVFAALAVVVSLSQSRIVGTVQPGSPDGIQIKSEGKNPWTTLKLNADPDQFQFAVVSDRTGGHREKVFSRAVRQVNLLQPQFVMSVGDLIEGYSLKEDVVTGQWDEFDKYVKKLEMPFFYVPGNHDLTNQFQVEKWGERYGRRYYHFTYKNVLFLALCSENPPDMGTIDKEQQAWVAKTLAENAGVRWTFVFLHKPIWTARDLEANGWGPVEKALAGRKYTVYCGHVHRYVRFERNGMQYFQLATTGGGSKLRGVEYGEFDQVAWVTMKKDAPVFANIMLDGILPHDLKTADSDEKGVVVKKVPTHPTAGKVYLDGKPLVGVTVTFHDTNPDTGKYRNVCDGLSFDGGRFQITTYNRFDGAPVGEFKVTVVKTGRGYYDGEVPTKVAIPAAYATPETTPLTVKIKEGTNDLNLELSSKKE